MITSVYRGYTIKQDAALQSVRVQGFNGTYTTIELAKQAIDLFLVHSPGPGKNQNFQLKCSVPQIFLN